MSYEKPRYTVDEACKLLGMCRAQFYNRMNAGMISTIKDGRRTYVTHPELMRYSEQSTA